ncbi:MAG: hypothetical protein LE180_03340, partial [Endomicrobium sp.]|uniref:hypothetical protein n=1 Tax=Candidatus Endomicrobiellum pyrsonymphae TaxID=1408203 RepID=UPI003589AF49|nr:hypothetical protein [Endomicrobium sp.]
LENIKHVEIAGKVQNAVERRKDGSFIITKVIIKLPSFLLSTAFCTLPAISTCLMFSKIQKHRC